MKMKQSFRKNGGMWTQRNQKMASSVASHPASHIHSIQTQKGVTDSSLTKRAKEDYVTKEEFEMLRAIQQAAKGGN